MVFWNKGYTAFQECNINANAPPRHILKKWHLRMRQTNKGDKTNTEIISKDAADISCSSLLSGASKSMVPVISWEELYFNRTQSGDFHAMTVKRNCSETLKSQVLEEPESTRQRCQCHGNRPVLWWIPVHPFFQDPQHPTQGRTWWCFSTYFSIFANPLKSCLSLFL